MKTFDKWCEDKKYNLNGLIEAPEGKPTTSEGSTKRAGVRSHAYPPIYSRGQYPKQALIPTAADAITYLDKDEK